MSDDFAEPMKAADRAGTEGRGGIRTLHFCWARTNNGCRLGTGAGRDSQKA